MDRSPRPPVAAQRPFARELAVVNAAIFALGVLDICLVGWVFTTFFARPYQGHVRAAKSGVRIWTYPGGVKLWLRDTRVHKGMRFDPRPRFWFGPWRVALLRPGVRIRRSRRLRRLARG